MKIYFFGGIMKKLVLILVILMVMGGTLFAFDPLSYPPPVEGGDLMLDIGIGLRAMGYSSAKWTIPPLYAQIEFALPVGVPISVGGLFTISSYGYKYGTNSEHNWLDMTFGGRANWHWGFDVSWLDLYTGLSLGYTVSKYTGKNNFYDLDGYGGFYWAGQIGAHFYFTKLIGLNVEFGFPYWVKAGVALKF